MDSDLINLPFCDILKRLNFPGGYGERLLFLSVGEKIPSCYMVLIRQTVRKMKISAVLVFIGVDHTR